MVVAYYSWTVSIKSNDGVSLYHNIIAKDISRDHRILIFSKSEFREMKINLKWHNYDL